MFNSFRQRARNFIDRMANNPAEASRAVFAGILIVGIFSLSLDFRQRIAPEFFEARLLDPLDQETLDTARELDKKNNEMEKKIDLIAECKEAREEKVREGGGEEEISGYELFLKNFEKSFAGILPGAGNLLLEYPATVNDRREKLIFEVMKDYAQLKFCIPDDQFKVIYLADYKNVLGDLNFFFQVRLYEENYEENPEMYPIDEINPVYLDIAAREYILVEKDLISTQKYVTEMIDRAIESAIALDQQTQIRVANLTKQTNNFLLNTIIAQENENIKISTNSGFLLEAMRDQDASENYYGGTTSAFKDPKAHEGSTQTPQIPSGVGAITSKCIKVQPPKVSFGLLNLLEGEEREDFLANHYGIEMAFYLAAKYSFDPLTPEGNALIEATRILEYDRDVYEEQMIPLETFEEGTVDHTITESKIQSTLIPNTGDGGSANQGGWPPTPAPINIKQSEITVDVCDRCH